MSHHAPKISVVLFLLVAGCRHEAAVAPPASGGLGPSSSAAQEATTKAVTESDGGGLAFSDEIKRRCPGLAPPSFSYDSARVEREWSAALSTLATCMKTGGLAGERVVLTGHTDPRGDDDYNIALGGRRADAVRSALGAYGVETARFDTTSRGRVDATGNDEQGWRRDRRVDFDLARSRARVSTR